MSKPDAPGISDAAHDPPAPWSSHQPNLPGRGVVAAYSWRFWMIVVLLGLATGVGGAIMMEILTLVEHASWNYAHAGSLLQAVRNTPDSQHIVVLAAAAGVVARD